MVLLSFNRLFPWLVPGLLISVSPVLAGSLSLPLPAFAQLPTNSASKAEADRLFQQGIYLSDTTDEAKLKALQRALELYRQIKDRIGEKATLIFLSQDAESSLQDYRRVINYQQQILIIARELRDQMDERAALTSLADAYEHLGEYEKAINYQQQILVIDRERKDQLLETSILFQIGDAYYRLGQYHKVIDSEQQILVLAHELKTNLEEYPLAKEGVEQQALSALANAYRALGDYQNATKYQQESLALEQEIKNYVLKVNFHSPSTSSNRTTVQGGDKKVEADQLLEQGKKQISPEAKISKLQQALGMYRQIKDREGEKNALLELGSAYESFGLFKSVSDQNRTFYLLQYEEYAKKAINYQKQSLAIARALKDSSSTDYVLEHLAGSYLLVSNLSHLSGDYIKVIQAQQQRLTIVRELKDRIGESDTLRGLGDAYYRLGEYAKAVDYEQQSLAIAREIKDRESERAALLGLGSVYIAQGSFKAAIDSDQQSLIIAREDKSHDDEGAALNDLGVALEGDSRLPEAEHRLLEAIAIWENLREETQGKASEGDDDQAKIALLDIQSTTYRNLQRVLVTQQKTDAALEIAERGRAKAFVDLLSFRIRGEGFPRTATSSTSLTEIKEIAKAQNATLVEYSIIDSVSGPLHDFAGVGLLEQPLRASTVYVWVVQPTGTVTFRKVDLRTLKQRNSSLDQLVASARCLGIANCESKAASSQNIRGGVGAYNPTQSDRLAVSAQKLAAQNPYLQQLHKLLIAPIADLLPADPNAHLIFMPQGSLFLVPFAALQDAQGKYLIEQHTIITAPSIQVLESTQKLRQQVQQAGRQQALVVGNPKMPLQLPQLPGAQTEAEAIAPLLHTQAIIGAQATKAAIVQQMPNARWIHLATHGILDDQQGLGSAIALAPNGTGETNDGLLTADEILNLKLNAELVVLSACDTGEGRITGDGVLGLSRSLITAGVPSVLVSLWAVNDDSTSQLMRQFYTNLSTSKIGKAEALRQAQLTLLKGKPQNQSLNRSSVVFSAVQGEGKASISHDLSAPYYWAPFILIGNGL